MKQAHSSEEKHKFWKFLFFKYVVKLKYHEK